MDYPLISVIITTKNEEKNIGNCLKSVTRQSYPSDNIEMVVVDNDSTDRTVQIARQYTPHVFQKGPERSSQRNFGIQNSQGQYILYLDADMILHRDVIKDCVEMCMDSKSSKEIIAIYVSEIVIGKGFWCKVRQFERTFYDATVIDCVRFVKKESFVRVGGFDESMRGPEDWDFDKKIRSIGKVALVKTSVFHNEQGFSIKRYCAKKGYYAKDFDAYISKWGKKEPDIHKQFSLWYRYFGVFLEDGKWKQLAMHPLLAAGMYFLRFLVGVVFLTRNK